MSQPYYDGYISRQELIDHCRAQLPEISNEMDSWFKVMEDSKTNQTDYETAFAKHYVCLGKILQLRTICDWFATNKKSEEDVARR